ncbi:hypothetical protein SBRY_100003 [Actinacidiphila bryophytorum]|uniref:Uncharacterized protein n=1 Tax=Actinacidiphila bryophytorum TaxID=1436133 RepID=A0A9W4E3U8_9ACTN|nr:hypothetical protein SBRY_100003 [Actinacidiphila bryophytorum]
MSDDPVSSPLRRATDRPGGTAGTLAPAPRPSAMRDAAVTNGLSWADPVCEFVAQGLDSDICER